MGRTSGWTTRTLPQPPTRPSWLGEESYEELLRAHSHAHLALRAAQEAEAAARIRRTTASQAAQRYERLLEEALGQLSIDDVLEVRCGS